MSNLFGFIWILGMVVVCWGGPCATAQFFGPGPGLISSLVAAVLWYTQFGLPSRTRRPHLLFFAYIGYLFLSIVLLFCLVMLVWKKKM